MPSIIDHSDRRFQYLPQDMIDLQREISRHPELREDLKHVNELSSWFATVGVYAGVAIDGKFDGPGLAALTRLLVRALIEKRTSVVISSNSHV